MLIDFDHSKPLYIFGDAPPAIELKNWVHNESKVEINVLSHEQFENVPPGNQCMIGFQNTDYRKRFLEKINIDDYSWPTFIHPAAHVEDLTTIGKGCVILNFVHIGFNANVVDFCYVATGSQLSHDSKIGKNCMLAPGVIIGGSTVFDNNIWIGLNSSFADKLTICSDTTFNMTSVVHKSVTEPGKYYGNRKIN